MAKPVLSDPIALRLPVDVLADIETIAAVSERTRSWVMVRAMRYYLATEGKDILEIERAREGMRQGKFQYMDTLLDELDASNKDDAA
ncbi:ribbon-helix-helix domain-containing protein [Pararhizobium sp. YC-54]|uniref:CopG family ribbon-helix-helix protein n=1 Tax=Pararhizobium sp. YC-54 TaxID=2986920 RepID=UPI0021F6E2C5|nr:ribbon-helix-helix domain-containing protein [Pararhizobium sp. YC-54]MCV9997749.1 ribbon-helix-helix domain-containing protein [Pararhizobium sp. YC-54]